MSKIRIKTKYGNIAKPVVSYSNVTVIQFLGKNVYNQLCQNVFEYQGILPLSSWSLVMPVNYCVRYGIFLSKTNLQIINDIVYL